ncbi:MAG: TonB-dependent receptor, partial [Opitutales bacterium]|nr:TonB-dependent receptor [Opitutales bacterium]
MNTLKQSKGGFWCSFTNILLLLPVLGGIIAAQDDVSEDVYELDPFTISEAAQDGYVASNSLAGTRSNTDIKDIPLNIQVFTNDLTEDFLITSQVDLERYNASLVNGGADVHSNNTIQQSFNQFFFRGFQQNWGLRDGVRQYDPIDTQGLSRVEIVKGPAAALYGLAYPGGLMNSISKTADLYRNFTNLNVTIDNNGENRSTIDTNISHEGDHGRMGIRFNAAYTESKDYRRNSEGLGQFYQVNLAWEPVKSTKFEFLYEYGYREKPVGLGTFFTPEVDANGVGLNNGSAVPIQETHPDIPYDWNWSTKNMRTLKVDLIKGKITHTFNPDFTLTAYWQHSNRWQVDSDGLNASGMGGSAASWDLGFSSQGGNATGWLNPNTPDESIAMHWHHRDWNNKVWAYGFTGVYNLEFESFQNLFTFGYNAWSEDFISIKHTVPGGSPSIIHFPVRANIDIETPIGPPPDMFVDVAGNHQTQDNSNEYLFASWQMTALDGRLKTNVAVNKADFKLVQWNTGASLVPDSITEDSEVSPLFGIVYELTDEVSLFAIRSSSLFPTSLRNDFQIQLPPLVGKSTEFGVKLDLMDGRISGTLSYYTITQEGGGVRDPNAENRNKTIWDTLTPAERALQFPGLTREQLTDQTGQLGDVVDGAETESKGWEADLVFQATKDWQIIFSYAHNQIEIVKHPNDALVGTIPFSGPIEDQFSLLSRYSFSDGSFEGLAAGLGYHHAGESFQGTFNGINRYSPSTDYVEVFLSYPFEIGSYDAHLRLNVKNLTEQSNAIGWKATGSSQVA